MMGNLPLLDQFEDMRANFGATLDECDVDCGKLFDDDGNLVNFVLANSVANGLEFEVENYGHYLISLSQQTYHNDLDNDFNADPDDDSHMAAVNLDPLDESDGDLDFLNDLGNNWTTIPFAICASC